MFRNVLVFVFIVIMVLVTHIFGPWLPVSFELEYEPGIRMPCSYWLILSGFHITDVSLNCHRASLREKTNDSTNFFWAVIYAQVLVAFPTAATDPADPLTPDSYCKKQEWIMGPFVNFVAITSILNTCEEWLNFYGYELNGSQNRNLFIAESRNTLEDESISLWPTLYARFITSDIKNSATTGEQFCEGVADLESVTSFMSLNDKIDTCRKWILNYGFINHDVEYNIAKAKREQNRFKIYKDFINSFAQQYIEELLKLEKKKLSFLRFLPSSSVTASEYPENDRMKPEKYCLDRGYPDDQPVKYFGMKIK